jgi:two-component system cell cycle response regulator DivK
MPAFLAEPSPAEAAVERPSRSILIIEDDETIAEVLALRLAQQGFATHVAHSGRRGMELAQSIQPQLVLLDLRLPDMDGLAVCRHLDENSATAAIPKMILSGMEQPDIVRRARAAGCQYYIRKPYDPNALLVLIEHAIREALEPDQFL